MKSTETKEKYNGTKMRTHGKSSNLKKCFSRSEWSECSSACKGSPGWWIGSCSRNSRAWNTARCWPSVRRSWCTSGRPEHACWSQSPSAFHRPRSILRSNPRSVVGGSSPTGPQRRPSLSRRWIQLKPRITKRAEAGQRRTRIPPSPSQTSADWYSLQKNLRAYTEIRSEGLKPRTFLKSLWTWWGRTAYTHTNTSGVRCIYWLLCVYIRPTGMCEWEEGIGNIWRRCWKQACD